MIMRSAFLAPGPGGGPYIVMEVRPRCSQMTKVGSGCGF